MKASGASSLRGACHQLGTEVCAPEGFKVPRGRIERERRMGVPVEIVAVGKCYLTEIGQVRRAVEIKEAMVNTNLEERQRTAHRGAP